MIVVVCLNPALDVTHQVAVVDWAGVNRPTAVYARPGGKGTNVARTLRSFGVDVLLTGFAGGATGHALEARLRQLAVPAAFTPTAGETRRTFAVVDGRGPTALFNEPGPEVSAAEFARFRAGYRKALAGAAAVALCDSLPRGLPSRSYAELIAVAAEAGVPAVLDAHGDALRLGAAAGPAVVKPNLEELRALTGRPLPAADGGVDWAAVTAGLAAAAVGRLQISENCVAYHGAFAPLARACLAIAAAAAVPVAVHLDHASSPELVEAAAGLGLGSVMYDASSLEYTANRRATADVARWCHDRGIWVEAELGEIGGKDGVHAPGARTDPGEAARFVTATAVDALAVAVGSSHAMLTRDAVLDLSLIAAIRRSVGVPLVLHGSSGVPDRDLVAAVRSGMTKVNIATQLNKVFTAAVRRTLSDEPAAVDPRKYGAAGRDAIAPEVARLLRLLSAGDVGRVGAGGRHG